MIKIGKVNHLVVARETNSGYYLKDSDSDEEVFLPPAMSTVDIQINQEVFVFVYPDTKGLLVATTKLPFAEVGDFASLRAINVQEFGAFFEWGIDKDLLVPGNEQKFKVKEGEYHIVKICLEEGTNRLYGTTKLGKFIESSEFDFKEGDKVSIMPVQETDLGYKIIINKSFIGMIYHNEIFTQIELEETYTAVVKKIREDGLVDCALQAQGVQKFYDAKDKIMHMLKLNDGKSELHDKSTPAAIKAELGISKQAFKSAVGMLYKERKIILTDKGIRLAE